MKYNIEKTINIAKLMQCELAEKIVVNTSNCAYYDVELCIDEFLDGDNVMSFRVFDIENKTLEINLLRLINKLEYDQILDAIKDIMSFVTLDNLEKYNIAKINTMILDYFDYKYLK